MSARDRLAEILRGSGAGMSEAQRIAATRAAGRVPAGCGPEIPEAPARGAVRLRIDPDRPGARSALMRADVFDAITLAAARRGAAAPLSAVQICAGRHYGALFERHACAGMRGSSIEAVRGGSGGGGSFVDAVLADRAELARLRDLIGPGLVKAAGRKGAGGQITALALVHSVAVEDRTLAQVLRRAGWSASGQAVRALEVGLSHALDRLLDRPKHQRAQVWRAVG
jgi:hypothetical protein